MLKIPDDYVKSFACTIVDRYKQMFMKVSIRWQSGHNLVEKLLE
jgi:ribosomal protein S17E